MTVAIVVLITMILLNAFFAGSEIALISLNENKVKRRADEGDKKAQKIHALISEPTRFLSTIQIGVTLSGFLASAFAADFFAGPTSQALYNMGVPLSQAMLETISVVAITIILSYFTLVFGELVPKQLALQKAEPISNFIATPLTWMFKIALPVVKLLSVSTNGTVRLFGVDPHADNDEATEEDIRMLVEEGGDKGYIQKAERLMINNVFEFNDKTASDIITHRTDMAMLPLDATLQETVHVVNREKYTRFPVYDGYVDNIVGVLHVKDLIEFLEYWDQKSFDLKEMIRKAYFALETQNIDVLFRDMQKNNVHIAIVLDEYGGTEGIITIEDVIEEIVGEIFSENAGANVPDEEIKQLAPNKFAVAGKTHLHDVEDYLEKQLLSEEYETLNGFLIDKLGYFPAQGEQPEVTYNNLHFKVEKAADKWIEEAIITLENNDQQEEEH
ncbi:hemolysin family protein [Lentibacillus sediminis]|uniref:hemolysin family protein n=1 Tax=Lentibacillus sediminis TaxID=1940529 RepID=UPI001864D1C0|nr:hemolysin family protein [Lentibacillus sediminis]